MEINKIVQSRFVRGVVCGFLVFIILCGVFMLGRVSANHGMRGYSQARGNYQMMQNSNSRNGMINGGINGKTFNKNGVPATQKPSAGTNKTSGGTSMQTQGTTTAPQTQIPSTNNAPANLNPTNQAPATN